MNKNRRQMDAKTRKKATKAIKEAQKTLTLEPQIRSDQLTPNDLIKRFRKKSAKTKKSLLASFQNTVKVKKKKLHAKHSKRTTPGTVEGQPAAPFYPHQEGTRWTKTLNLQNQIKNKILRKKLSKKR